MNRVLTGCLCALGCEFLYGMSFMFTKRATEIADTAQLLGWRFLIGFAVMSIPVVLGIIKIDIRKKWRQGSSIRPLLLVGMFFPCIYFVAETVGISHTTSSESGIVLAVIPVVSLVASSLILKKKPTKLQVAGILVTVTGAVITVVAVGTSTSMSPVGYTALAVAVLSYSLYCVYVDKASDFTGYEVTYFMLFMGAVVYVIYALAEAGMNGSVAELVSLPFRESAFLMAILYQGIGCSVFAFFLNNLAIARIGVNRSASFVGVATVVSIAAGALIMKETVTLMQIIGAGVILAGVYIANSKGS